MNILAALVIALSSLLSLTYIHSSPMPTPPQQVALKWGAYTGWKATDLKELETIVGKPANYQTTFVHWGNENQFPIDLATPLKNTGKTLVIYWEAMNYNLPTPNQPEYNYRQILSGRYDAYIKSFATSIATYGDPVILAPFEEANGDWYPWSGYVNGNTPALHIQTFQYIHKFFTAVPNVKFAWDMNSIPATDSPNNQLEDYYPGDQYVDYIGINGFNFDNPSQSWSEIFSLSLSRVEKYQKPVIIMSTATGESAQKATWIKQGLEIDIKKYPQVVGWIWFNENKERDWRINSSPASLAAFKLALP